MKKIVYGILIILVLTGILIFAGGRKNTAPLFTYVYSGSMEPMIHINDVFLVWPNSDWKVGDIVMYRPQVLQAEYIVHRIIGIGESGFITKGDNAPYPDQDNGEPQVRPEQMIGKVVTINGNPVVIPGLGKLSAGVKTGLGKNAKYISLLFLLSGILIAFTGAAHPKRKSKPRHRVRLGDIYHAAAIIAAVIVMISIYFGSKVTQVRYLVSEYPGTLGDQVEEGQPGQLFIKEKNTGLIPVWNISTGMKPISINKAPSYILPFKEETITLDVLPQYKTGYYLGYVQVYNYPMLMPRIMIKSLHRISPILAILFTGLVFQLWCSLLFHLISHIPGFEKWIPLKAIKDKITERRFRRFKRKYIQKGRSRTI